MKKYKGILAGIIAGVMVLSLSGCGSKKNGLIEALQKNNDISSFAYKAKAEIKVNGKVDESLKGLDKFTLELDGKASGEKNKSLKTKANIKLGAAGISADTDMIEEMVMNGDKANIKMFLRIPEILKVQAGTALQNIDYVYVNSESLEKMNKDMNKDGQSSKDMNIEDVTKKAGNVQESISKFIKEYTDENGKGVIEDSGKQKVTVNGAEEELKTYKIKIDNEGVKKLLKSYIKDENRVKEVEAYLKALKIDGTNKEQTLNKDELNKKIDEMGNIFGKNGAVLNFAVKDGYVVQQKMSLDLLVNNESLNIDLVYDIFDINKPVDIKIPNPSEIKAVDLVDLASKMVPGVK